MQNAKKITNCVCLMNPNKNETNSELRELKQEVIRAVAESYDWGKTSELTMTRVNQNYSGGLRRSINHIHKFIRNKG